MIWNPRFGEIKLSLQKYDSGPPYVAKNMAVPGCPISVLLRYLSILFTDTASNASKRRIRHKRTAATSPMLAAVKAVAEQPKGDPCHRCLQHGGLKPKWGLQFCVGCLGDIRCKHVGLRTHGGGADAVKENKLMMTTDACGWRKDMEGYGIGCNPVHKAQAHARTREQASKHLKETYEEDAEFVIDDDLVYTEDHYVIHCKTWHPDWSEERSRHDFELKLDGQTDKYFTKGAKRFPRIRIPDPQARIRKQTGVVHKRGVVETNEIPSEWAQAKSRRLLAKLRDGVQGEDADGGSDSDDDLCTNSRRVLQAVKALMAIRRSLLLRLPTPSGARNRPLSLASLRVVSAQRNR